MSDTVTRNKEYFDKESATYESRHQKTLDKIVEDIRSHLDFIGDDWASDGDTGDENDGDDRAQVRPKRPARLLDYACGTGTISRALAPFTTQCVGIDLAPGMVAAYNARAENQGLTHDEMYAYQGNLCVPGDNVDPSSAFSGPEFFDFDVAAVGLGFHHFDDPHLAAKQLVERLRPGGVLMIIDFFAHAEMDGSHPAKHTVMHHGFSESQMKDIFENAGAGDGFAMSDIGNMTITRMHGGEGKAPSEMKRRLFIARGTKKA